MPRFLDDFSSYVGGLLNAWGKVFILIALLSLGDQIYLRMEGAHFVSAWIYIPLLLLSFTLANFLLFQRTREKIPDGADINIKSTDSKATVKTSRDHPEEIRITTDLDFGNDGDRKGRIWVDLEEAELNTHIFKDSSVRYSDENTNYRGSLSFPIEIEAGDFYEMSCQINADVQVQGEKELAEELFRTEGYTLTLKWAFDGVGEEKRQESVQINGSYEKLKEQCKRNSGEKYLKRLLELHEEDKNS